jgi:ABC-type glutathione transport system ATPase component
MADTRRPILEVDGVSKTYSVGGSTVAALRHVHLAVAQGEVAGLVGESGSGKSTLARIVLGLERPDEGEVRLAGATVGARRTKDERRSIQIVFQDPRSSLNPRMRVLSSVEDFAVVHRLGNKLERRNRALAALESVHISEQMARRRPPELSGGQLQRACIARALVTDPALLVADEPTSSLDVSIQGQILNLLHELRGRLTMVLISHDMAVIRYLADRICVMFRGEVVESGSTEQLMRQPQHEYTKRLIRASLREPLEVEGDRTGHGEGVT